jgi:hypothetical protein
MASTATKVLVVITTLEAVMVFKLAQTVASLENYRYASFLGYCEEDRQPGPEYIALHQAMFMRHECLLRTETRMNPLWHLWFALTSDY